MKNNNIVNWADISPWWNETPDPDKTFVDLFCGAGGLSKGFELAGLEGICGLDWFKEAGQTYRQNLSHPFVCGDIKQKETKELFYKTVEQGLLQTWFTKLPNVMKTSLQNIYRITKLIIQKNI